MNERQKEETVEGGVMRTFSGFEGSQAVPTRPLARVMEDR
jgi:hypothetical protein